MALIAALLMAQLAGPVPPAASEPRKTDPASTPRPGCSTSLPTEPGVIVVCAPPQQGYRLDPDVMRARKMARDHSGPKRRELLRDTSCQAVGPAGCISKPTINVLGAVATAVEIARTALTGGNVGRLFITNPQPTEYEIYAALKADREAAKAAPVEAGSAPQAQPKP